MASSFLRRLGHAAYDLRRIIAVGCALVGLLLEPQMFGVPIAALVFGIPLAITALRPSEGRAFRLWALYIGSFLTFWVLRNMADDVGAPVRFAYPITFDRWLFGAVPSVAMQAHWYHGVLGPLEWLAIGTYYSYFIIPPLALVAIWWRLPIRFPRYVVASALLFFGAAIIHALLPTAPPWLASHDGYLPPVTQLIYRALQLTIPATIHYGSDMIAGNYVAAMPSVHMGVVTMLVLAALSARRWITSLAIGYAALMTFAIMYTGDHYAADAIAGIALSLACWVAAGKFRIAQAAEGEGRMDAIGAERRNRAA